MVRLFDYTVRDKDTVTPARRSGGFVEQFAPDQHAPDLAGARTDFIQFGVAPQTARGVIIDVAVTAQDLYAFAGHPGGFFRAIQDDGGAILAHLAHMARTELVQVLAHRIAESAAGLQGGV